MSEQLPDLSILRRCWSGYDDPTTTHTVTVNGVNIGGSRPVIIAKDLPVEPRSGVTVLVVILFMPKKPAKANGISRTSQI